LTVRQASLSQLGLFLEPPRNRNEARSRRKPQPLRFKTVRLGDLVREGKVLDVHCANCRPERHLYSIP
jgi:hypothetical protein